MSFKKNYYLFLTIIQSVSESLPVSSSTHIKIFNMLWQKHYLIQKNWQSWEDLAHLTTAIALIPLFCNLFNDFEQLLNKFLWIIIVDSITLIGYLFIRDRVQRYLPAIGLIFTGLILFLINFLPNNQDIDLNLKHFLLRAFAVGVLQSLAFIPGVSRLGLIFSFLRFSGFSINQAWYFSWLAMLPLLIARFLLGFYKLFNRKELSSKIFLKLSLNLFIGSLFAYGSLYIMFNFLIKSTFIFIYPFVLGVLCYIYWPN